MEERKLLIEKNNLGFKPWNITPILRLLKYIYISIYWNDPYQQFTMNILKCTVEFKMACSTF